VLRRKRPGGAWFRLPGAMAWVVIAILTCIILATRIDLSGVLIVAATMLAAMVNWLLVRNREKTAAIVS
jgi:hypothetical protein